MSTYRRVWPETPLTDGEYAVIARYKHELFDEPGDPWARFTGTYDECAEYAERNESEDNPETYYVAEVIE